MESSDEQGVTGVTRREMIAKSVVAGGLVWSAPVLLSGRAGASTPCCAEGTPYTIKVAEQGGVNCGVACISHLAGLNFDCPDKDLQDCLNNAALGLVVPDFTSGGADTATIKFAAGISIIAAGVKSSSRCYLTSCGSLTASQTDAVNPNTCVLQNGSACGSVTMPPNRIWVEAGPNGSTLVKVNTHAAPDGTLNHVEVSVCLSPQITGMCP